jgi:hypothetical protein
MKRKAVKRSKKLTLSAETLRNLTETDLQPVEGGATLACPTRLDCTATHACSGCAPCA